MIRVASYCRVSTDQEDQINSFEAQQQFFREYIERCSDWELYRIYADKGITGTSTAKREAFNRMISDAHRGKFQIIITKEVSRFSRNILDTIHYTRELKTLNIAVLFMNDGINTMDPDAELRLSIMASIAQEESRKTSSRVVWGQTRQMEKGVVFGHSMLGYDVRNGHIMINPEGAEIVKWIFQKYAIEQVSTAEIVRGLTAKGWPTASGSTQWTPSAIHKILKNEKYVGDLIQKKSYTPDFLTHKKKRNRGEQPLIRIENHHEPIVSREVWEKAQERRSKNNKHDSTQSGHSSRYAFSGKIRCGECGSSFVVRKKYLKDGTVVRRWCCGRAAQLGRCACDVGRLVRDDDAMQMMQSAIAALPMDRKPILENVSRLALDAIRTSEHASADNLQYLYHRIEQAKRKKEAAMDSYLSGEFTKTEMLAMKLRYDELLDGLHERLTTVESHLKNDTTALKTSIEARIAAILNGEIQNEIFYKIMLQSLTVYKDRHMELRLNHLQHVFQFTE